MATITITGLTQICILSENLEETVRHITEKLGIGPWKCWDFEPPAMLDTHRDGKPAKWTYKQAVAWVGDIQLEVIESTSGATIYRQYLDTHGESIQHLLVDTRPGYFAAIRELEHMGYNVMQGTKINPPMLVGGVTLPSFPRPIATRYATQFVYHDTTEKLGTVIELAKMPPGFPFKLAVRLGKPDFTIRPNTNQSLIDRITAVGLLVNDLEAAKSHWEALGIGPWSEKKDSQAQILSADLKPTKIELVQPESEGIFRTLLNTHGPGVRYLGISGMRVKDFTALGCPVLAKSESGIYIDGRSIAHTIFRLQR